MTKPYPESWDTRAPRLATIAAWINEHTTMVATCERSWSSTDRKLAGTRLIHPGKGRNGYRIKVWEHREQQRLQVTFWSGNHSLLDHNSAETYRVNAEVVQWLAQYLTDHPHAMRKNTNPTSQRTSSQKRHRQVADHDSSPGC